MSGRVVLVVGDDPYVRELVQMVLEVEFGVGAALAAAGEEVLRQAQELRPRLVLLDVGPAGFEGLEVVRELRSNQSTQAIPILALTYGREGRTEALEAGCDDCLGKPFDIDAFVDKVRKYLRSPEAAGAA